MNKRYRIVLLMTLLVFFFTCGFDVIYPGWLETPTPNPKEAAQHRSFLERLFRWNRSAGNESSSAEKAILAPVSLLIIAGVSATTVILIRRKKTKNDQDGPRRCPVADQAD